MPDVQRRASVGTYLENRIRGASGDRYTVLFASEFVPKPDQFIWQRGFRILSL